MEDGIVKSINLKNGEILKQRLTQEYLKECLTYNPDTGIFTWNERPLSHFKDSVYRDLWNRRFSQVEAGTSNVGGYILISIDNKQRYCQRLAFLYMEGYFPENDVDHIDRNKTNNKWSNLREVSTRCNMQNCNLSKNNTSGVNGVCWDKSRNKWEAKIMISRKTIHLGRFDNFEDAVMARYQEELNNPRWSCSVESTAYKYLKERNLI